ncbi:MAG: ELWxxDGT repeat protein [Cyanobacteriota bacterium]|nr:ELWxxDGT repeat protein [Cyanobacteriota bacterium]
MPKPFQIKAIWPSSELVTLGGRLYFFANDSSTGKELWVSNGTDAGTRLVKDLVPGWESGMPMSLMATTNKLFFIAWQPTFGMGLCVSNGTAAGTRFLTHGLVSSLDKQGTAVLGDKLFFVKQDGAGLELWQSDGTARGTKRFFDINPGPDDSAPAGLTRMGNKLFFVAAGKNTGSQLWMTDGRAAGTRRVTPKLNFLLLDSSLAALDDAVLFAAVPWNSNKGKELWISDGTAAGTRQLVDIHPSSGSDPRNFMRINQTLFFTADDGIHGEELWITDGTARGTRLIKDIHPGRGSCDLFSPTPVGNRLFFIANDGQKGVELWVSDGTHDGTRLVKDLQPGIGSSHYAPKTLTAVGDKLYFTFDDPKTGRELWCTDGSAAGTRLVVDLRPGWSDSGINAMAVAGNHLFFPAEAIVFQKRLWALDVSADLAGAQRSLPLAKVQHPRATSSLAITADTASKAEGQGGLTAFSFTVTRTGPLSGRSSASWRVSGVGNQPAKADDFANQRLPSGTVTFAAGEARQTISVRVSGDLSPEDDERFRVSLFQPRQATLGTASATATIQNDDLPTIQLTVSPAVQEDGKTPLVFLFRRDGDNSKPLTVTYRLGGTATPGLDYSGLPSRPRGERLTFAAGSSTTSLTLHPAADASSEPDETVALTLMSGAGYRRGTTGAVIGTIRNDDVASYRLIPSLSRLQEGETLTTTVRTTGVAPDTRLYWGLSGDGVDAADFTVGALTGSDLVGGDGSFSFRHSLRDDASTEGSESLRLRLYTDAGRTLPVGDSVTVTILDSSRSAPDPLAPRTIRESDTINATLTSPGEVDRYVVDVVSGAILTASLTSTNPTLYPLIHLKDPNGALLKNPIAYNGHSADLGMVDLVTGKALLDIKTQIGATGSYVLTVAVATRDSIKADVLQLTNLERAKEGLAPLTRNSLLEQAAQAHVEDMDASNSYLAHTGSNGSSPVDRIKATGYKAAWVDLGQGSMRTISSENAASGYTSANQVVDAWMKSSGHRAAIMDPATKEIGVGFDYDNQTGTTYWLQNFGHPWSPGMTPWF